MKKNLKIAITPEQPLGEVVRELQRLGYAQAYCAEEIKTCVCTYDRYFNCYSTDINQFGGYLTSLHDLRKM